MNRRRRSMLRPRPAHTLVEMVIALPLLTMLFAGLASAIFLARRVAPDPSTSAGAAIRAAAAWDQIVQDLGSGTAFTTLGSREVVCTVPDRNGDAAAETIRYAWSGATGAPLTRQMNGSSPESILSGVQTLSLAYVRRGTTIFNLECIDIYLQVSAGPAGTWCGSVAVLNQPEVAGP